MKTKSNNAKFTLTASLCLLLLGGCQHLPNKSAKQTMLDATNMQLKSNGYNIQQEQKLRVYYSNKPKNQKKSKAHLDATTKKIANLFSFNPSRTQALDSYVFKPYKRKMSYAIDRTNKKVQIDYEFHYKPKNFELYFKAPMLLDFSDMSITLDPSMLLPALGVIFAEEIGTKWDNKLIKFTLPKHYYKDLPIDLLVRTLEKTMMHSVEMMPEKSFVYKKQNKTATPFVKQLNPAYAVNVSVSAAEQLEFFDTGIKQWIKNIKAEVKKSPNEVKNPEALYEMLEKVDAFIKKIYPIHAQGKKSLEDGKLNLADMLTDAKMDYYFDNKDRVIGYAIKQRTDALADIMNIDVDVAINSKTYNYGKPVFTLKPTPENTVNGNALFEGIKPADLLKYLAR